jgi:hypothetical protein
MRLILILLFFISSFLAKSQILLTGKVINERTKEPLAFVNIVVKNTNTGTASDIDGHFQLTLPASATELIVSYVGYASRIIPIPINNKRLDIQLKESTTELREIVVIPGENPAFKIIRQTIKNKPNNDPENLSSFSYNSYNKLYSTLLNADSASVMSQGDTAKFNQYIRNNHLFAHESYTERKYKRPNLSKEVVLGNHLSGIKDPFITFVGTDLQPFSFYKDFILLFNTSYINPVSTGSFEKYHFILMDTIYHPSDSVFVISFEPLPGKVFEALRGQLYISSDGYAIEHVMAQPADDKVLVENIIQQKYEKIDGHWFPVQQNSELRFKQFNIGNLKLKYVSHTYISNIKIGVELDEKDFGIVNVELSPQANKQDENFWRDRRQGTFDVKEKNTFHNLDSVGENLKTLQAAFKILEGFFVGRYKAGKFYLPTEYLLQFNRYEGARIGLGIQTGEQISKRFNIEVFGGYGINDQALKYGGAIQLNLHNRSEAYLKLSYRQDLSEPGKPNFIKSAVATRTQESLRNFMASRMDNIEQYKAEFGVRPFQFSQLIIFVQHQKRNPTYHYTYLGDQDIRWRNSFTIVEAGLQWRFAFKEQYLQIGQSKIVTKMSYPQLNFSLSKSFTGLSDSPYDFTRLEMRFDHQFLTKPLGKTTFQLASGYLSGSAPYPYLYNGKGSRFNESLFNNLVILNSFQTMGIYEFLSDRYAYLFINQNVGRITGNKSKRFRPELSILHNMGIGSLKRNGLHQGIAFKTMEKGYLESGLMLSNLIRFSYLNLIYLGFGAGGFYRYGNYALQKPSDNLAMKLIITLSF